ncbi:LysR family transcriptional regulator [Fodinicola acaciae]|uniref:LysR family transcriptional regulator n=1 Tax=Fodinicola acaciae TaxID=2681555 RepID=UPI0013D1A76B|nr:LysR family transcriptional regulator [Fodinicola acaciae]
MDVDLGQVRAFVAVADQLHFGHAAARLFLTQQALSKRVKRLEQVVGAELFTRTVRSVALTPAGERFLPYARDLLAIADAAAKAVRASLPPLRVDVWGQVHPPMRMVREIGSEAAISYSMRRNDQHALTALRRGELDLAFVGAASAQPDGVLTFARLCEEPMAALVHVDNRLASLEVCTVDDLRATGLWFPDLSVVPELERFFHEYAQNAGIPYQVGEANLSLRDGLAVMADRPELVTVLGADWDLGDVPMLRRVPLEPAPAYEWWMAWRTRDRNPALAALLSRLR